MIEPGQEEEPSKSNEDESLHFDQFKSLKKI
jgi:hypothetical protein